MGFKGQAPPPTVIVNPTPVTVNPTPVTVVTGGKDFYIWPGYTGEDYPPTFTNGTGYARAQGSPVYRLGTGSTPYGGQIVWAPVGARGPDPSKTVQVFQCQFMDTSPASGHSPGFGFGFGDYSTPLPPSGTGATYNYVRLYLNSFSSGSYPTWQTYNGAAGSGSQLPKPPATGTAPPMLAKNVWHTLTCRAPGSLIIDGVTIAANAFTSSVGDQGTLAAWGDQNADSQYLKLANVYATWEAPA